MPKVTIFIPQTTNKPPPSVFFALLREFGFTGGLPNCAPPPFRSDFLTNIFFGLILLSHCFYTFQIRPRCR